MITAVFYIWLVVPKCRGSRKKRTKKISFASPQFSDLKNCVFTLLFHSVVNTVASSTVITATECIIYSVLLQQPINTNSMSLSSPLGLTTKEPATITLTVRRLQHQLVFHLNAASSFFESLLVSVDQFRF